MAAGMNTKTGRDLIHRWKGNPAITIENLSFPCADICNAGVVKYQDEYLLLTTIQSLKGSYSIYLATSQDGLHFSVADEPLLAPRLEEPFAIYEEDGILDCRVTAFEGYYYLLFDALGKHGYRLGLARTKNFKNIERLEFISEPDTKSGALFPAKIKGRYARLARPWEGGSIWISYSDDLVYWGASEVVITPRGGFWDSDRIGVAAPPMRVKSGWLIIYYGVKNTSAGPLFRLGAVILDPRNPAKVLGRTDTPILSPREDFERIGDMPNLVYSCGALIEEDDKLRLYYGAANSCIAIGTAPLESIISACLEKSKHF